MRECFQQLVLYACAETQRTYEDRRLLPMRREVRDIAGHPDGVVRQIAKGCWRLCAHQVELRLWISLLNRWEDAPCQALGRVLIRWVGVIADEEQDRRFVTRALSG